MIAVFGRRKFSSSIVTHSAGLSMVFANSQIAPECTILSVSAADVGSCDTCAKPEYADGSTALRQMFVADRPTVTTETVLCVWFV
ncbi:MAG: hypothetical protein K8U57_29090 [Planctomycetes bacterium]|nr:hypothetical protein [Planctomycetota bacterium]